MAARLAHGPDPLALGDARRQLHHAAQVLGSSAHALLEHAEDDSHANLGLDAGHGSLCTRDLGGGRVLHLELEPCELVLRRAGRERARFALAGRHVEQALAWAGEQLGRAPIALRTFVDFPELPFLGGAAFEPPARAHNAVLAGWFGLGVELFETARRSRPGLGEARVWPHHFDLGALLELDSERTIGLGLSPGDGYYDQPYLYASPYPAPAGDARPALALGHWHERDFVSAVATGRELLDAGEPGAAARRWLEGALAAGTELLS